MKKLTVLAAGAAIAVAATLGTVATPAWAGATLDAVQKKGFIQCGVNLGLFGFSSPDEKGNWSGLDVDTCRAVAAGLFGDSTKVKYSPLSTQQRFTAVQSGEVDILARNTTMTLSRESANGMNFAPVTYFDGQGFLVPKKLGVKSAKELDGATICVLPGTTSEQNVADYFRATKMAFKPVVIEKNDELNAAFIAGRCDALSSDASQLAAIRANETPNPDDYIILPELISKEPLAPAVRQGDDQWADLVRFSVWAMMAAEEKGITSKNIDTFLTSPDPEVKRLLGVTEGNGKHLGVSEKWGYNIISQVGNYGEVFERNVGKASKLKLDRGLNNLWTNGGLHYPAPFK